MTLIKHSIARKCEFSLDLVNFHCINHKTHMFSSVHGQSGGVEQIVTRGKERKHSSMGIMGIMVLQMPNFLHVREVIFFLQGHRV